MKTSSPFLKLVLSFAFIANSFAVEVGEQLTRGELMALRKESQEQRSQLRPDALPEDRSYPTESPIIKNSVFLSDGRHWTFIPKGSILSLPEAYKNKVIEKPKGGKFMKFKEFCRLNRGWVMTNSVSMEQARGGAPINEGVRQAFERSGRIVISVLNGGPITTCEHKEEQATAQNQK